MCSLGYSILIKMEGHSYLQIAKVKKNGKQKGIRNFTFPYYQFNTGRIMIDNIPSCYSPESIVSLFGICYFCFCLFVIIWGREKAWLSVLSLSLLGILWIGVNTPGTNGPAQNPEPYQHMLKYKDQIVSEKWLIRQDKWQTWHSDQKHVYNMHVPGSKHYISSKIYHPAAWVWCPLISCLVSLIWMPHLILWIFLVGWASNKISR